MSTNTLSTVFFDIGNTLGVPRISPPPYRLEGLDVYPYIPAILQQFRDNNARIGIISNTGNETADDMKKVLEEAGIYSFFEPSLLIYSSGVGLKKNSPKIFELAVERAGYSATPDQCLFVGEDSQERSYAIAAGLQVAPHPSLAWEVLKGSRLRYIRVSVPAEQSENQWRYALRDLPVVPLHITGDKGTKLYAIATTGAIARLDDLGFEVDRLGSQDDPLTTEMYLLRDDRQTRSGFLASEGHSAQFFNQDEESKWVLSSSQEGLYIALPAGRSVEEYHFEEAYHGHNLKLLPDMSLLAPFGVGSNARTAGFLQTPTVEPSLSDAQLEKLSEITPELIRGYLERYAGVEPLDGKDGIKITSRHIHSPDNARVTEALANELQTIGDGDFSVKVHRFVHEGRYLDNVEAQLHGEQSNEIVLVTAHLDSTAASSDHHYDPEHDPAPGADDDASGVAAVLAIAKVIKNLAAIEKPKRTIRFVLFNAEEHGLVGSQAYARDQAAIAAPIVAVYQMDMIGYNVKPPRSFEVHVGYEPSTDVQDRSLLLAKRIQKLTKQLSPELKSPQIYTNPDPAAGRSDHASFHQRGYTACVVSEDFFAGPQWNSPEPEANPNYHKDTDELVDFNYAADIARVVAAAALATANL